MFHAKGGLYFERSSGGGVTLHVFASNAQNAIPLRDITLSLSEWHSVVDYLEPPVHAAPSVPKGRKRGA